MKRNDIGESYEIAKFIPLAMGVVRSFYTEQGLFICSDESSLVLGSRICDAIYEAVMKERQACVKICDEIANQISPDITNPSVGVQLAALKIIQRNISEAT